MLFVRLLMLMCACVRELCCTDLVKMILLQHGSAKDHGMNASKVSITIHSLKFISVSMLSIYC